MVDEKAKGIKRGGKRNETLSKRGESLFKRKKTRKVQILDGEARNSEQEKLLRLKRKGWKEPIRDRKKQE